MANITDTDSMLDKCSCKARGRFVISGDSWRAECEECGAATKTYPRQFMSMTSWNRIMRGFPE